MTSSPPSWSAAFRFPRFNRFQGARTLSMLALQTQSVATGWQISAITGRAIDLAWVGLAQFLPSVCLSLVTGHVADRFDRQKILLLCHGAMAALSATLLVVTLTSGARPATVPAIYAVLVGVGVARA